MGIHSEPPGWPVHRFMHFWLGFLSKRWNSFFFVKHLTPYMSNTHIHIQNLKIFDKFGIFGTCRYFWQNLPKRPKSPKMPKISKIPKAPVPADIRQCLYSAEIAESAENVWFLDNTQYSKQKVSHSWSISGSITVRDHVWFSRVWFSSLFLPL